MQKAGYEIERKFLIAMPDINKLSALAKRRLEIVQAYLLSENDENVRIRKIIECGKVTFIKTVKKKISAIKRLETECSISEEEYMRLLEKKDPNRNVIQKTRYCVPHEGHTLEIDIFPFWKDKAFLEIELSNEEEFFSIPQTFTVIREVTEDKRYTNAAIALEIPE